MKEFDHISGIIDDLYRFVPGEITTTEYKDKLNEIQNNGYELVSTELFQERYVVGFFKKSTKNWI